MYIIGRRQQISESKCEVLREWGPHVFVWDVADLSDGTLAFITSQHSRKRTMAVMSPETFCLLMAALYGGFGITMYANLTFFYGPDSIISYVRHAN